MDQNVASSWEIDRTQASEPRGAAVALWLQGDLKRRYDDALREPLPRELLALVEHAGAAE
jgi:hypothetical protein